MTRTPIGLPTALPDGLTPRLTRYVPVDPTPKQRLWLLLRVLEAFYGGAAGPGKSWALLMAALQFVDVPGYNALIVRSEFTHLTQPNGLLTVSQDWLTNTDAVWRDKAHRWEFPSGATLTFGYLSSPKDRYRYQGGQYHYVGFDEVTEIREIDYRYLFSRVRRPKPGVLYAASPIDGLTIDRVPLRVRAASNPGGTYGEWPRRRFVDPKTRRVGVVTVPGTLADNPHLDRESYEQALAELDPVTRAQLLSGDWNVRPPGSMFRRSDYVYVTTGPPEEDVVARVRYWDLAATEQGPSAPDPDWTVGLRLARTRDGFWWIEDVVRFRRNPADVERAVAATAERDGRAVPVWIEAIASWKIAFDHYARNVLPGFTVRRHIPTDAKPVRARIAAAAVGNRLVRLVDGAWVGEFVDETEAFTEEGAHGDAHDDQVDAFSGALTVLTKGGREARSSGARTAAARMG